MMNHRHSLLQRQNVSAHENLYRDAQARADKLESKKREVYCSDQSMQLHRSSTSGSGVKPRPPPSCVSLDLTSACSMPAGDRLYAYHLKKEVRFLLLDVKVHVLV